MDEQKKYWIGFNIARGIGPARLRLLLDAFGDAQTAWNASPRELAQAGLGGKLVEALLHARSSLDLDRVWENIARQGITVLTWDDADYPRRLREIDNPPPTLYLRGGFTPLDDWAVAIVGTRRVTAYGRQVTEELAAFLAANGITVVSGLARGTDAIAHKAALDAGGRTIAVLGSGVDKIYPPENKKLAAQIETHGALISDYAVGTLPEGPNFPPRNRIISGLSLGIVVVEAGHESGALITADFAAEQGREVFAVPGNITAPQSRGTNQLIQGGAHPLLLPADVLDVLQLTRVTQHQSAAKALPENDLETRLYSLMQLEPVHIDEISIRAEMPVDRVSAALTMMELKGIVRQVGGMQYIAVRETQPEYDTRNTTE
jgi:DNA processing protein